MDRFVELARKPFPPEGIPGYAQTRHQAELLREISAYAQEHFAPIAARWDRDNAFPRENFEALQARGWLSVPIARVHGGFGYGIHHDPLTWVTLVRELSRACGNTGQTYQIWGHCISMIEELATPAQAARFVTEAAGGLVWCSAGSEPTRYTQDRYDTSRQRATRARRVEGGVVVSGRKLFISNASVADRFFVFAQLEHPDGTPGGLVHPVICRDQPGVQVLGNWDAMGMRGTGGDDIVFDDVFVAERDVIALDTPDAYYRSALSGSFLAARACVYLGIADAALDYTTAYLRTRSKTGRDPVMQLRVGELKAAQEVTSATVHRAAWLWQQALAGRAPYEEAASFTTLTHAHTASAALKIASDALELCGGRGMLRDAPLERYYRDVRAYSVSPPTHSTAMVSQGAALIGAPVGSDEPLASSLVHEGV